MSVLRFVFDNRFSVVYSLAKAIIDAARHGARFAVLDQPHCCVKRMRFSFDDEV